MGNIADQSIRISCGSLSKVEVGYLLVSEEEN